MATISRYKREDIRKSNKLFSAIRTTVESVMYSNNVEHISSIEEAYHMAKNSLGTIITDLPVYEPEKVGIPKGAKVLLFNDGEITGRYAPARVILGSDGVDEKKYAGIAREAAFHARYKKLYHAEAYIGLHEDFMVKAHLVIQEGYENTLYNWLLNFQYLSDQYKKMYEASKEYPEGDIMILSLPDYYPKGHEDGLALFDSEHNTLLLCGMRYFGEHKKGTLTLAWGTANRNGFASCHGGLKRYNLANGAFTVGVFGLSGSGKSTLTHNTHGDRYDISILHDDAYVISEEDASSVALEPSYFDKTQDYPMADSANKYLLTVQNCGATLDEDGKVVLVNEDIRNGNGRAIKSQLWTKNRINKIDEPVDAIIWLMKDSTLPPIVKLADPILASVMGATLATKRSTAERLAKGVDMNALVIEPYANPFRTYPLSHDYLKFKELFSERNIDCYIFNTGAFIEKDIPKEVTLGLLEQLVEDRLTFVGMKDLDGIEVAKVEGFAPDMEDPSYRKMWMKSLDYRISFLEGLKERDRLPEEALSRLKKLEKNLL